MCRHVYESVQKNDNSVQKNICPLCAQCTHETDWVKANELHRQWIADGKADWNKCPQGGTLRGWWSI